MLIICVLILWLVGYVKYSNLERKDKTSCYVVSVVGVCIAVAISWLGGAA